MDCIGVIQRRGTVLLAGEVRDDLMGTKELEPVLKRWGGARWVKMTWESFPAQRNNN